MAALTLIDIRSPISRPGSRDRSARSGRRVLGSDNRLVGRHVVEQVAELLAFDVDVGQDPVEPTRPSRRRVHFGCLDWVRPRGHVG